MIETLIILSALLFPAEVNVRITGKSHCEIGKIYHYHTEQVPFKDYVKGVMVNEFGHVHYNQRFFVERGNIKLIAQGGFKEDTLFLSWFLQ